MHVCPVHMRRESGADFFASSSFLPALMSALNAGAYFRRKKNTKIVETVANSHHLCPVIVIVVVTLSFDARSIG